MASAGDVVELVHEQTYLGQGVNNVYFFEAAVADASIEDLADWFETNVVAALKVLQIDLLTHVNLRLRNLFDSTETHEEPLTGTGTQLSGAIELPAFFAWQIRFDHLSNTVRPGFKRFSGFHEPGISDALIDSSVIPAMATVGALLVNPPSVANADWAHVVVGRVCDELNPVVGAVPRCLKYVLPSTQAEASAAGIGYPVSYEVYTQPTTQNSRKWYT